MAPASTANANRLEAGKRYSLALKSYAKPRRQTDLLYDPAIFASRDTPAVTSGPPVSLTSFPKLLAAGTDDTMDSHKSYEIAQAIAAYSAKMATLDQELAKLKEEDKTFQGYSSADLADAFTSYAKDHDGLPDSATTNSTSKLASYAVGAASLSSSTAGTTTLLLSAGTYSWAALLMEMQWARVLYCIVWIVVGLLLMFFGYASIFWLNKIGSRNIRQHGIQAGLSEALPGIKAQKRQKSIPATRKRPFLSGGLGGLLIGFLFFSYLASVINNALCADDGRKALGAGAYFAVWLAPGLLGAVLGGYFFFLAKVMAAVLGATCLTTVLTAMFGVQTLLVRVILLAIFSPLLTVPMLLPRINPIQTLLLNGCTSIIGVVTFLNGVALFAPPYEASANWIDLLTMLFCKNDAATKAAIVGGWGTSAFKGYIAGAVLGAVIGFVFELLLHSQSGKDADSEWNEYLGTYTQRLGGTTGYEGKSGLDTATSMAAAARAGLFEPAPSAWHRMVDFFDSEARKPAHYGNLSGDGTLVESISEKVRRKKSSRSAKTAAGVPARFEALSKRDDFDDEDSSDDDDEEEGDDDDDDDATELGSEDEKKDEAQDLLATLKKKKKSSSKKGSSDNLSKLDNYRGYALPRPPMFSPAPSYNTSQLSGTTARDSQQGSQIHKSAHVYRDGDAARQTSPPLPTATSMPSSSGPAAVTATPSLINAISRIQVAQQAARAWQEEHNKNSANAPYKPS